MTDIPSSRLFAITAVLSGVLLAVAMVGIFLVAPEDADQGVIQRIFYFHVAIALTSLVAFGVALVAGIFYLRRRQQRWDDLGVVSVRLGLMLSALTIITGSIWAKASWDRWWVWEDPRLVTFLLVVMLYVAYLLLRSSVDGEKMMRYSAIFAIVAFVSVPLSFYAVRIAQSFIHPVVFTQSGANMPNTMLVWFVVSQIGMLVLLVALTQFELLQLRAERALGRLKVRLEAAEAA